jgi:hypothetical protein
MAWKMYGPVPMKFGWKCHVWDTPCIAGVSSRSLSLMSRPMPRSKMSRLRHAVYRCVSSRSLSLMSRSILWPEYRSCYAMIFGTGCTNYLQFKFLNVLFVLYKFKKWKLLYNQVIQISVKYNSQNTYKIMNKISPPSPMLKLSAWGFQVFAQAFQHLIDGRWCHCGSKSCSYSDDPKMNKYMMHVSTVKFNLMQGWIYGGERQLKSIATNFLIKSTLWIWKDNHMNKTK